MNKTDKTTLGDLSSIAANAEQWPGIDSTYRLIIVASLRNKQLQRGAHARIAADPLKHKNTSIALEEVKQGLVPFTIVEKAEKANDGSNQTKADGA